MSSGGGGSSGGSSSGGGGAGGGSSSGSGGSTLLSNGIGSGGSSGGSNNTSTSSTNFLSPSYSNPFYEGRPNQSTSTSAGSSSGGTTSSQSLPGGFGQQSFGTVSSTSSSGSGISGTTGSSRSLGGSTSGSGRSSSTTNPSQQAVTRVIYTTSVKFPVAAVPATQLQSNLQSVFDRSSALSSSGIQVTVGPKGVILRGQVADEDQRRLAENMIRLTPGVRDVDNKITIAGSGVAQLSQR
jgi:osmotically-inducible protein OsmY